MALPGIRFKIWFLSLIISATALAQWNPHEIQSVTNFNETARYPIMDSLVNDPHCRSVEDNIGLMMQSLELTSMGRVHTLHLTQLTGAPFRDSHGQPLSFPVEVWENVNNQQPIARSLVVYLPGIFQDARDVNTLLAVHSLLRSGHHVVVIPNTLSESYMQNGPVTPPAAFEMEAHDVLNIIKSLRSTDLFHNLQIRSLQLVGASYGAFLAAVILALDSKSDSPVIQGQTTLLFPPFQMNLAVNLLDRMIGEHQGPRPPLPRVKSRVFNALTWLGEKIRLPLPSCSSLVGLLFHSGLTDLVKRILAQYRADSDNNFQRGRHYPNDLKMRLDALNLDDPEIIKSIRFRKVINDYISHDVEFYDQERADLSFWLMQAYNNGVRQFRVLTTDDDWLNHPGFDFKTLPDALKQPEHLLIRKTGGHAGLVNTTWFEEFAHKAFLLTHLH